MSQRLLIKSVGAVTPVGLTASQTCAAFRARISGFSMFSLWPPPRPPQVGAVVPVRRVVRSNSRKWLANLAARAIAECLDGSNAVPAETALLIGGPEHWRCHPAFTQFTELALLEEIQNRFSERFHSASCMEFEGHASCLQELGVARDLLESKTVRHCIVGGVDSMINATDFRRLDEDLRLQSNENPQGLIPGEGAAFLLLGLTSGPADIPTLAEIRGLGTSIEKDTISGSRYSVGDSMMQALKAASEEAQISESEISFVVSDMNGERYRAWETVMSHSRYYRSLRARLPVWYPATSTGDTGSAAGALAMVVAAMGIVSGNAPGSIAMCEASSDDGLRAACLLTGH